MAHQASSYEVGVAELVVWYQSDHALSSPATGSFTRDTDFEKQLQRRAELLEELAAGQDEEDVLIGPRVN